MKLWKHVNNRDVALQILKSFYVKEKRSYKMKVEWWNIGPHKAWPMNITQRIVMPVDIWIRDWVCIDDNYRHSHPEASDEQIKGSDSAEVPKV